MSYSIPEDIGFLERLVIHLATQYDLGQEPCLDFDGEIVENSEYDLLYRTLKDRKPESEAFTPGRSSPSQADVVDDDAVAHNPPMTSIDKADGTLDEKTAKYKSWMAVCEKRLGHKPEIVQSYKHDGVAVRIYYEKGKLVRSGLRPNRGVNGTNVTIPIQYVKGVPTELPLPLTLAIGGELECLHDDFAKVQAALEEADEDVRANPRNHTYGAINAGRSDVKEIKKGRVSFMGYAIINFDDAHKYYKTKREMAIWVNKTLKIPFVRIEPHNFDDLATMEANVKNLQYEVDGIILEVNDREDFEQLGHIGDDSSKEPRGAIAWKFEEERAIAEVDHIEWNASRTGRITPVAIFAEPVLLAGTKVKRATCSNIGWLLRMKIGQGSKVKVYKAGKIIPKVECVVENEATTSEHPANCPTCGTQLIIEVNEVKTKGVLVVNQDLVCKNTNCAAKHVEGIAFYLNTVEAKGLKAKKIERIIASGKVKELPDLYTLSVQDLVDAEFSAREALLAIATIHHVKPSKDDDKLAMDILTAKGHKKKVQGWQFFAALGIPGAGKTVGKALFDQFKNMNTILLNASLAEITDVPGIGDKTAQSVRDYFADHGSMVERLLEYVEPEGPKVGGKLEGKIFCLSGSFDKGKTYWEQKITEASGKVSGSVGKKTSYLVAGPGSGSKSETAQELGITIITEAELEAML